MADDRDQFAMTSRLDPQNAEAVLVIVERDALDDARQHFLIGWYGPGLHNVLLHINEPNSQAHSFS